jgi:hypothetical protein
LELAAQEQSIGRDTYDIIKKSMRETRGKLVQGLKTLCWNTSIGDNKTAFTIGAGGVALGVFSFGHMLRCGKEAINALRLSGNNNGCVWYSAMQAMTHATSLGLTVLGFVSPLGRVLTKCPILAALPSMVGYGMDHFQSICTNPDHIINKSGQWGLDNKMINLKGGLGNLVTFTPKLFDFWANKIRAQDEYIFKNYFGVELDRPELFTPTYTELKRA